MAHTKTERTKLELKAAKAEAKADSSGASANKVEVGASSAVVESSRPASGE